MCCRRSTGRFLKMNAARSRLTCRTPGFRSGLAITLFLSGIVGATGAFADDDDFDLKPGNLLVSRSVYDTIRAMSLPALRCCRRIACPPIA
jgi:hypothetical protein